MLVFTVLLFIAFPHAYGGAVGFDETEEHAHPYQVSFRQWVHPDSEAEYAHFCSGVLLNKNWVLSAASCFDGRDLGYVFVSIGDDDLDKPSQTYSVNFAILPEDYETSLKDNIALVRLVGDVEFNEDVQPISLPSSDFTQYGILGEITGWFPVHRKSGGSHLLEGVFVPIISNEECSKWRDITEKHICIYDRIHDNTVHEDTGAPLIVDDAVVGIQSYGTPDSVDVPVVYTRVYNYVNWISKNLEKLQ